MTIASDVDHRRHLAILFSDLSDSTQIAAALEPEHYSELLEHLRKITGDVVAKHGGQIIRIDGDGAIAMFGFPERYEDLGRRATEAALDLHSAVNNIDRSWLPQSLKIKLHSGIHSGIVLLRPGDLIRGRYEILGNPTNITARLCDFAAADEIVVSDVTLGSDRHFFQTSQPRRVNINGQDDNLLVHTVVRRAPTSNRFEARARQGLAPFVGRERDLKRLRACLDKSASASNIVVVSAEAGIGKTRFVNEFLKEALINGYSAHQGFCESYFGTKPLQPFGQIVKSILISEYSLPANANVNQTKKHLEKLDEPLAELGIHFLSLLHGETTGVSVRVHEIFQAILTLLNSIKGDKPFIISIDDWQWADDASVRMLAMLQGHIEAKTLFVLATRSYDRLGSKMNTIEDIKLSPLSERKTQKAIEGLLQSPSPFVIERIKDHSGGNPLFIEELCHSLNAGSTNIDQISSSTSLPSLILSRFENLSDQYVKIVKNACVIGHMIPSWLLQELTQTDASDPALEYLSEKDFIHVAEMSGMLRFNHGITREVIYEYIELRERKAIHRRIVEALHNRAKDQGEDEHLEALSYHYGKCGNAERAYHYAVLAGDRALASSALDRAQAHFRSALHQIEELGENSESTKSINTIVRKFGLASVVDPSREQVPVLQTAADKAAANGDVEGLAWAEYWLGFILYGLGEPRLSIHHLEIAKRKALLTGDTKFLVQIDANLGQAHAAASEYQIAIELLDQAIDIKRKHRSGTRPSVGLSYSLSCKGFVLADQGAFENAYRFFDEAVKALCGIEHEMTASIMTQRSACYLWQGRLDDAIEQAEIAKKISGRVKARYLYAMSLSLIAAGKLFRNVRSSSALHELIESTQWLETSETHQFLSLNYGWLATFFVASGQFQHARQYAAHAILRARKGDRMGEAMAYRAMVRASLNEKNNQAAQRYLRRAYHAAAQRQSAHETAKTQICDAELAILTGDNDRATQLFGKARAAYDDLEIGFQVSPIDTISSSSNRLSL